MFSVKQQRECPFGVATLECNDGVIGVETCEELFTARSPHIDMALDGVEIIGNGSGSHHQLRKLNTRADLMLSATSKCGGVYLYANQQSCDGGRLYYDGSAMVVMNGSALAQATQFSVLDVEVVTATVDLDDVRTYRASIASRGKQATNPAVSLPRIAVDFNLAFASVAEGKAAAGGGAAAVAAAPSLTAPRPLRYHSPEEECGYGPACWMWDYLRRSGAGGFMLALSGGADSSATAAIMGTMTQLLFEALKEARARLGTVGSAEEETSEGREVGAHVSSGIDFSNFDDDSFADVVKDVRRVCGRGDWKGEGSRWIPHCAQEIAWHLLHSAYMGTVNSSEATRDRAARLAREIGIFHLDTKIDGMVASVGSAFSGVYGGLQPRLIPRVREDKHVIAADADDHLQRRNVVDTAQLSGTNCESIGART